MNDKTKLWLKENWLPLFVGVAAIAIALLAIRVHLRFWSMDTVGSDTYYSWVEGRRHPPACFAPVRGMERRELRKIDCLLGDAHRSQSVLAPIHSTQSSTCRA